MVVLSAESLRKKRLVIFFAGVFLCFFTSMGKVIVPGTVFNDMQAELGFNASSLANLGAGFMYAYSFSQLAMGIFSDRYGGVRLLLYGGTLFCAGFMPIPFFSDYSLMLLARIVMGFGAGTVFLGAAKLAADLYPNRFTLVLGIVLVIGYLGPVTGGLPMSFLVAKTTWRTALAVPALFSVIVMCVIFAFMRGTVKNVVPGNSFKAFFGVMASRTNILLFVASSVLFGSYYALLTVMGQKCLEDTCGMTRFSASLLITVMALIVAANNIVTNMVLKMLGGRRRVMMVFASVCGFCGVVLGLAAFHWRLPVFLIGTSFILIAIPAGFFSIFSTISKELNPPERVGLSVSMLNFCAFVAIAAEGHAAGVILKSSESSALHVNDTLVYPSGAYAGIFLFFSILAFIGLICALFVPETRSLAGSQRLQA